jgi:CubicO group peptidase (beta-lactamase class C family)
MKFAQHALTTLLKAPARLTGYDRYTVQVPRDLKTVTDIGVEVDPALAGISTEGMKAIIQGVKALYRSGAHPGISISLRRRGHVVLNRAYGHARGNAPGATGPKQLMRVNTPVCVFSASKAVTAMLVHKLAEEGGIDLDAPVARYWPAFGKKGKTDITISQVLSHRAGLPSLDLAKADRTVERLADWQWILDKLVETPAPRFKPVSYHAITGGYILGEVIQRVTGQPLRQYLDEKLRKPLGMDTFTYGLDAAHRASVAENAVAGMPVLFPVAQVVERALMAPFSTVVEASNHPVFMEALIPSGNIYATAEELSRFYQMLLDGGVWQGRQVMKAATIARAIQPVGRVMPDASLMIPMLYSEGLMLGGPMSLYGPRTTGAYGHLGFMNILGWADPRRELSCALLVTGKAVLGPHLVPWMKLLATIGQQCRQ